MTSASLEEKVAFLKRPSAYGAGTLCVEAVETHMSWVFLTHDRAYKLKKPMRLPFLDFSELAARERNCREEFRLNRRLTMDVYLDIIALRQRSDGSLGFGGSGAVVDWLVEMRRLPEERMLSRLLAEGRLGIAQLHELTDRLADFYQSAERPTLKPQEAIASFVEQQALNRQVLLNSSFDVDHRTLGSVVASIDQLLERLQGQIEARVEGGHYVEGHGDLRPEHVCFTRPLAIFDCLEFSRTLRTLDPFDELSFLGMECAYLGADWVAPILKSRLKQRLHNEISDELCRFYASFRALTRARMALGHLYFGSSADLAKWQAKTDRYAQLARHSLGEPLLAR